MTAVAKAGHTGTDPTQKYAWGENIGWANAADTNRGVSLHYDGDSGFLIGYAWGENIGWINVGDTGGGPYENTSADNWGVNMAYDGSLSGYAWGENVGWLNFEPSQGDGVHVSDSQLVGFVWAENIGWVSLSCENTSSCGTVNPNVA